AQRPARHLLALPARVHVGGVEERDAEIEGLPEVRAGRLLVQDPRAPAWIAVRHAAEAETRDLEPRASDVGELHRRPPGRTRRSQLRMSSISSGHTACAIGYSCHSTS